jgi:hypothetical protein
MALSWTTSSPAFVAASLEERGIQITRNHLRAAGTTEPAQ